MEDTIFILNEEGKLIEMNESLYDSENLLQQLLMDYPKLMAGNQINPTAPRKWLLISRETGIPDTERGGNRWSLDHLFIDQDAIPTLVEVKRSTDTRIRREVVGQVLDYAANAALFWSIEELKVLFAKSCENAGKDPTTELNEVLKNEEDTDQFWEEVNTNLKAGKIRILIVADIIPIELKRIIEFLNGQMSPAEILGVEVKQYVGQNLKTLVPRVIGQTTMSDVVKRKNRSSTKEIDEDTYWEVFRADKGKNEIQTAEKIVHWLKGKCDSFEFGGSGLENNGIGYRLAPITTINPDGKKDKLKPFMIWTNGKIDLNLGQYKKWPPFDQKEYKVQLLKRLNNIRDANIPEEKIDKYPPLKLTLLSEETELKKFIKTFEWFYSHFE